MPQTECLVLVYSIVLGILLADGTPETVAGDSVFDGGTRACRFEPLTSNAGESHVLFK